MLPYEEISDLCKKSEDIVKKFIQQTQIPNNPNPYNPFIDVKSLSSRVGHDQG